MDSTDYKTPIYCFPRIYLNLGGAPERDGGAAGGREGGNKCRGLSAAGMRRAVHPYRPLPKTLGKRRLCRRYPIGTVAVQNPVVKLDVGLANRHDLVVEPGSTTSTCKFDFLSKNNVIL